MSSLIHTTVQQNKPKDSKAEQTRVKLEAEVGVNTRCAAEADRELNEGNLHTKNVVAEAQRLLDVPSWTASGNMQCWTTFIKPCFTIDRCGSFRIASDRPRPRPLAEVDAVKSCLKRMLYLTTLAGHMASRKRTAPASLTHEESPARASKCRALGRHPTATPVPEFS